MKIFIFALIGVFALNSTAAKAEDMNIHQNNWRLGGSVGTSYSTYAGAILALNPFVEYFAIDHLGVGAAANLNYGTYTQTSFGPVATYYFFTTEKWAFSVQEDVTFYTGTYAGYTLSTSRLGADYFITPSVSFGPSLSYATYLSTPSYGTNTGTVTILGSFSIFL